MKPPIPGGLVCRRHGGGLPSVRDRAAMVHFSELLASSRIAPIDESEPEANPLTGFLVHYRQLEGLQRLCLRKIAELPTDEDVVWGTSMVEVKEAAAQEGVTGALIDASYRITKEEAKLNVWVALLLSCERLLMERERIYIGAGIEQQRLGLERAQLEFVEGAVNNALSDLGHDPADPEIRKILLRHLSAVPELPASS
jgi:hypothetical protein